MDIGKRHIYWDTKGIQNGEFKEIATCNDCHEIRNAAMDLFPGICIRLGNLWNEIPAIMNDLGRPKDIILAAERVKETVNQGREVAL